jgi:hypothetical protein
MDMLSTTLAQRDTRLIGAVAFTPFAGDITAHLVSLANAKTSFKCNRQITAGRSGKQAMHIADGGAIRSVGLRPPSPVEERSCTEVRPPGSNSLPFWNSKACTTTPGEIQTRFYSKISDPFINSWPGKKTSRQGK